jgi:hypothetical protein
MFLESLEGREWLLPRVLFRAALTQVVKNKSEHHHHLFVRIPLLLPAALESGAKQIKSFYRLPPLDYCEMVLKVFFNLIFFLLSWQRGNIKFRKGASPTRKMDLKVRNLTDG